MLSKFSILKRCYAKSMDQLLYTKLIMLRLARKRNRHLYWLAGIYKFSRLHSLECHLHLCFAVHRCIEDALFDDHFGFYFILTSHHILLSSIFRGWSGLVTYYPSFDWQIDWLWCIISYGYINNWNYSMLHVVLVSFKVRFCILKLLPR